MTQLRPAIPHGPDQHMHGDWLIANHQCPHEACSLRTTAEPQPEREDLALYGVTHRVELSPVEDDRWDYMLTVTSPAGTGQALLTPDERHRLCQFLLHGKDPGPGQHVDTRCRCMGTPHEKYGEDCCLERAETDVRTEV